MEKKDRSEFRFDALVYEYKGEYMILDYIFLDYWKGHLSTKSEQMGSVFKGATCSTLKIINDEEIAERLKDYDGEDIWRELVHSGKYTGSLDDFNEEASEDDTNVYEEHTGAVNEYTLEDDEHWEAIGGGRCFDAQEMRELLKAYPEAENGEPSDDEHCFKIYDVALFKAIIAVESGFDDYLAEQIATLKINLAYESNEQKKKQAQEELRHLQGYKKAKAKK